MNQNNADSKAQVQDLKKRLDEVGRSCLQLQQRNHKLESLQELVLSLFGQLTYQDVLRDVARNSVVRLGAEACSVYTLEDNNKALVAMGQFRQDESLPGALPRITRGEGSIGWVADRGEALLVADLAKDDRFDSETTSDRALIAVPIMQRGRLLGVLQVSHPAPGFFDSEDLSLYTTVAAMTGVRVDLLRRSEQLKSNVKRLQEGERLQSALYQIATLANSEREMARFFRQLHRVVGTLMNAENFYIAVFDREKNGLRFPYYQDSVDPTVPDPDEVIPLEEIGRGITAYVMITGDPIHADRKVINKLIQEDRVELHGTLPHDWIGVPLRQEGRVMGALVLQSYDAGKMYSDEDMDILVYVSQHISAALERRWIEAQLTHGSLHDGLTGLPNRTLFMDRIDQAMRRRHRDGEHKFAVLHLGLDRFKVLNDGMGHSAGDLMLNQVSERLHACLREVDTAARMVGDEFAVLLDGLNDQDEAMMVASRIRASLARPYMVRGREVFSTASVGVVMADDSHRDPESLLRDADAAMYQAKDKGKDRAEVFDGSMHDSALLRLEVESGIRLGLERDEFVPYYQPTVDLESGKISGFEALARWQHPDAGLVYPNDFIPQAEDAGMAVSLDLSIFRQSAAHVAHWRTLPGYQDLSLSVNMSPEHFSNAGYPDEVSSILELAGLPPENVKLEITERLLLDNMVTVREVFEELRKRKLSLSLDDFGTGYSSLAYLHRYPMDILKVDRTFVCNLPDEPGSRALVRTILDLARNLRMEVIAEGIETLEQAIFLRNQGCQMGQGYYFSRPVDRETAEKLLSQETLIPQD